MTATENPAISNTSPGTLSYFVDKRSRLRRSMGLVTLAWIFGSVWTFASSGVPFTRFAQTLHASNFQFGLLAALPFLSSLICLPASLYIDRTGERKIFFLVVLYAQRLLWIPIALVPIWMVTHPAVGGAPSAVWVFIALCGLMWTAGSAGFPAWLSWMADIVPEKLRGVYFSRRRQVGFILALPACLLAGWWLDARGADPMSTLRICAFIFLASAVFGCADISMFLFVPAIPRKPQSGGDLYRSFTEPLRNRQFLIFCSFVGVMVFSITFIGQFQTLYLMNVVGVTNTGVQIMMLVAPMAAQFFFLPLWGKAADRFGKKPLMVISSLGIVPAAFVWCFIGRGDYWFPCAACVFGSVLWNGVEVANTNLQLEFSVSSDDGSSTGGASYSAVNTVLINVAGCVGGVVGGLVAEWLKDWHWTPAIWGHRTFTYYDVLFIGSGALRLLAIIVFLPIIHEPEARPTAEALRFMSASVFNGVFNTVRWPARFFMPAFRHRSRRHQ